MPLRLTKLISLFLSFCLILEQSAFAQSIDLSHYFANSGKPVLQSDKFRPLHLRYLGYDNLNQDFKLLLDKGDTLKEDLENKNYLEENTQTLLKYFFIGLALPNEKFWVNLRPDAPDNIIDDDLARTDVGKIFLEADLQLKKDTASFTSPQTKEGKEYWDKLYKKAGELFGTENITIPTLTRPWIVPNEIIIREAPDNAYIYKATLKVMLEEDYLGKSEILNSESETNSNFKIQNSKSYEFKDPRLKELNEYSTQLLRELIIPKLTYQVNTSKRYAPLRQVYYSLILAQWFKQKLRDGSFSELLPSKNRSYSAGTIPKIDSGDLTNLISKEPYDKQTYFKQYQKSFKDGEYNLSEPIYTPYGQSIRRYMSGGARFENLLNPETATFIVGSSGSPLFGKENSRLKSGILSWLLGVSIGASVYLTGMPSANSGELNIKVDNYYSVEHRENREGMGQGSNVSFKPMAYATANAENKSEKGIMDFIELNMPSDIKEFDEQISKSFESRSFWNDLSGERNELGQRRENLMEEKYLYKNHAGKNTFLVPIDGLYQECGITVRVVMDIIYIDKNNLSNGGVIENAFLRENRLREIEFNKARQDVRLMIIIGAISTVGIVCLMLFREIAKVVDRIKDGLKDRMDEYKNIRLLRNILYDKSEYFITLSGKGSIFTIERKVGMFAGCKWALAKDNRFILEELDINNRYLGPSAFPIRERLLK